MAVPPRPPPVHELDVRPLLRAGTEPLPAIEATLAVLRPGDVLVLRAPFQPTPLLERLRAQGHRATVTQSDEDVVVVEIVIGGTTAARPGPPLAVDGLRTDQAPPLEIPISFFALAPLAMAATGIVLARHGLGAVAVRQLPLALAATHAATLAFLGALMLGALYQMIPVVAGAPVPRPRLAHAVHAAWLVGIGGLLGGFVIGAPMAFRLAQVGLGLGVLGFLLPVAVALARAPARSDTVRGMRVALTALAAVAALGLVMAGARAGGRLPGSADWLAWTLAHASLGGLVWTGGLIAAVSWQVVPMFYLAAAPDAPVRRAILACLTVTLIGAPAALLVGGSSRAVLWLATPAAIAVWLVHPFTTLRAVARRRRRRPDASLAFWLAGLACGPVLLALAVTAAVADHPRWPVALGFVALWGWAGLIGHGMVHRIVAFLVWFHRFGSGPAAGAGPSLRQILPEARVRTAWALHVGAVLCGTAAIVVASDVMARAAGVLLAVAALVLARNLVGALATTRAS